MQLGRLLLLVIALFTLLISTQSTLAFNTFGPDDRKPMFSKKFPWSAIGKVRTKTGDCSGSLVWKDVVLTNAHCVIDPNTKKVVTDDITFLANYTNGRHLGAAKAKWVYWGSSEPNNGRQGDWALLRLDKPLGIKLGYFGWTNLDFSQVKNLFTGKVIMAGYSGDFYNGNIAGVHAGCSVTDDRANFLLHNCDTTRGASGGPIFIITDKGQALIIALNAAEFRNDGDTSLTYPRYTHEHANIAVKPIQFQQKLRQLRAAE